MGEGTADKNEGREKSTLHTEEWSGKTNAREVELGDFRENEYKFRENKSRRR